MSGIFLSRIISTYWHQVYSFLCNNCTLYVFTNPLSGVHYLVTVAILGNMIHGSGVLLTLRSQFSGWVKMTFHSRFRINGETIQSPISCSTFNYPQEFCSRPRWCHWASLLYPRIFTVDHRTTLGCIEHTSQTLRSDTEIFKVFLKRECLWDYWPQLSQQATDH